MATNITGNQDGQNGSNKTYTIPGRGSNITKKTILSETKNGKHPNHIVVKGEKGSYLRSKPTPPKNDNVNKGK